MNRPYFFFDLDGPILDVSNKYYQVYKFLMEKYGHEPIDKDLYWTLKRKKEPVDQILSLSGAEDQLDRYRAERVSLIETDTYISYDKLQPNIMDTLTKLAQKYTLILVTLRGSRPALLSELERLDLIRQFESILSSGEHLNPRWKIKYNLVQNYFHGNLPESGYFIGDTDTDISAGKNLGFKTIGVNSGIRNEKLIKSFVPDYFVEYAKDIFDFIDL